MITTLGLGLLGGTLLGVGYIRGDLDLVAAGLVMTGLAIIAGVVWAFRDRKRG